MSVNKIEQFRSILMASAESAGHLFSPLKIEQLVQYYQLVLKWNPQLHLTTITEPEDFWQRHIFEAVFVAEHLLPEVLEVWDLGSGLGVPGVPLAIIRPDLRVNLVESNRRKAIFLAEVVFQLALKNSSVLNQRFESLGVLPGNAAVTARAVEKFQALLPFFLHLGATCLQVLLIGGVGLVEQSARMDGQYKAEVRQIPKLKAAYLIILTRST